MTWAPPLDFLRKHLVTGREQLPDVLYTPKDGTAPVKLTSLKLTFAVTPETYRRIVQEHHKDLVRQEKAARDERKETRLLLHAKILAVLLLSGLHGYLAGAVRKFAEDKNEKPARHWRIVNEIPTLLMIVIVILVIVKPF